MRDAFNTTFNCYAGPNALVNPGGLKGAGPCRLVIQDGILFTGMNHLNRFAWLTLDAINPIGSWAADAAVLNPGLADQFTVATHPGSRWWNLYTETVNWHAQPVYYRANLVPLPIPFGHNPINVPSFGVPLIWLGQAVAIPASGPMVLIGNAGGEGFVGSGPLVKIGKA